MVTSRRLFREVGKRQGRGPTRGAILHVEWGNGWTVTQMSKLEDEVRRLREENERLRGTSSGSSRMEELASDNNSRKSFWSGRSWGASEDSDIPAFGM
ncbi:hypothetical protein V5O48_012264 [Marasmius crinis-equi]|uniref:Transposase n=1 Tax=Marasmius crinis-equi TaxID=585013 RepID=A0ABR3F3A7_9AGAR